MTKPIKPKPAAPPRLALPRDPNPEEEEAAVEEEDQLPWEEDLALWEQEEKQEGDSSKLVLYRRLANQKHKEKVWEWYDENPGSHFIGLQFGGGKYSAYLILPGKDARGKPRVRVRHFMLGESYSEEKRRRERAEGLTPTFNPMQGGNVQVGNNQADAVTQVAILMERVVAPIMEMMIRNQPAALPAPVNQFAGAQEAMAMVTHAVQQSTKAQIDMARDLSRELVTMRAQPKEEDPMDGDDIDEKDVFDWKEFLKDTLKEFGPELLSLKDGIKMRMAKAKMEKDEIFQTLAQNKFLFDRVHGALMQDPEVDKVQAQAVLAKLSTMGIGFNVKPAPMPPGGYRPTPAASGPVTGTAAAHAPAAGAATHAP